MAAPAARCPAPQVTVAGLATKFPFGAGVNADAAVTGEITLEEEELDEEEDDNWEEDEDEI